MQASHINLELLFMYRFPVDKENANVFLGRIFDLNEKK